MRIRAKFCGMTCAEDAVLAARLGVSAIGMVFYAPAKTAISTSAAREIAAALPPFVSRVALFVNPVESEVRAAITAARPHYLQFHGEESPAFCESFGAPYIKAFRVRGAADIARARNDYPNADGILLDAFSEKAPGGSGESFRWELARDFNDPRLILAGGLTAENVREALTAIGLGGNESGEDELGEDELGGNELRGNKLGVDKLGVDWSQQKGVGVGVGVGVDVSSGISREGDRRRKDFDKMRSFMEVLHDGTGSDG